MASLSCPDCGVKVQPEDLICFRCGANLPHSAGPDEDLLTPTISQRFIAPGSEPGSFCPNCGSGHTELTSQFGSTPCKALYKCLDCREPFDHVKTL